MPALKQNFCFLALWVLMSLTGIARAQQHTTLDVEQPAFARMPVWLDFETDNPCLAVHYKGDYADIARVRAAAAVALAKTG